MRRVLRLLSITSVCGGFLVAGLLAQPWLLLCHFATCQRVAARGLQTCARLLLWLLGLKVSARGEVPATAGQAYLLVSNHQSYLDIIIIAALCPTLFVAKSEVGRWPLLGWLAQLSGTLFIKRDDARSNVRGVYHVSRCLRAGVSVQVFPEGTTSDGATVLPFHSLFFAAALRAQTPVLPLTIKFQQVNGGPVNRESLELLCWYGETNFAPHFWQLLQIESAEVSLMIHEPIAPVRAQRSQALATAAQRQVAAQFVAGAITELKRAGEGLHHRRSGLFTA